jgi:hypothetical protein
MQIINSQKAFFVLDTSESESVEKITVFPVLQYDALPADVYITYKGNPNVVYVYALSNKARLYHEILSEYSAGRLANWIKVNAERTHRTYTDHTGELVVQAI